VKICKRCGGKFPDEQLDKDSCCSPCAEVMRHSRAANLLLGSGSTTPKYDYENMMEKLKKIIDLE